MPPNQLSWVTILTPGIRSILSRSASGIGLMIEVRFMTNKRSALAISAPRLNTSFTTARNANRNKATANEPIVRSNRIFLRNRLAKISPLNFMTSSRRHSLRLCGLRQQAFLQMKSPARPARHHRSVRHHQHRLDVLFHQLFNQAHNFVGTLAIQVAGGLVA